MRPRDAEVWLQVTAGQGPVECTWAVVKTLARIEQEARSVSLTFMTIDIERGEKAGTARSALVSVTGGTGLNAFIDSWKGTVQWTARSPFRPNHRRKNWFVGVQVVDPVDEQSVLATDLRWEAMRASGPGGQHVNRTESAVRVTHLPTGIQAAASEERSQHRNRKLALARLFRKVEELNLGERDRTHEARWRAHYELERGSPIRIFRESA